MLSRAITRLFVTPLFSLLLIAGSQAADFYVDVTNATAYTMLYLQVSPADARNWEEDVLGDDVIHPGQTQRVNLYGYYSPVFDIRLIDEEGDSYTFWEVDVSRHDIVVTLDALDD